MGLFTLTKSTLFTLKMYRLYWPHLVSICVLMPITYLVVVLAISQGDLEATRSALTGYITMSGFNVLFYMLAIYVANTFEEQVLESYVLLPVPFWEIIASTVLAQALIGIPPLLVGITLLLLVSSNINIPLLLVGLTLILVVYTSLGILLGVKVKSRIKLDPILVTLMMFTIIATPVYYRLLYVNEPYRTIILLNPLTHITIVLRAALNIYEGFPAPLSILYTAVFSTMLILYLWWRLRGGAFTVLEKR